MRGSPPRSIGSDAACAASGGFVRSPPRRTPADDEARADEASAYSRVKCGGGGGG